MWIFLKIFLTTDGEKELQNDLKLLKQFDTNAQYGPCVGKFYIILYNKAIVKRFDHLYRSRKGKMQNNSVNKNFT